LLEFGRSETGAPFFAICAGALNQRENASAELSRRWRRVSMPPRKSASIAMAKFCGGEPSYKIQCLSQNLMEKVVAKSQKPHNIQRIFFNKKRKQQ